MAFPDSHEKLHALDERIVTTVRSALKDLRKEIDDHLETSSAAIRARLEGLESRLSGSLLGADDIAPLTSEAAVSSRRDALAGLRDALAGIDRAASQREVLAALLEGVGRFASRSAVFLTRAEGVEGWGSFGFTDSERDPGTLRAAYAPGSPWERLAAGRGLVALSAADSAQLASELESQVPQAAVLIPMALRGRLAAALYADRLDEGDPLEVEALQALAYASALAIESLPVRPPGMAPGLAAAGEDRAGPALPVWGAATAAGVAAPAVVEAEVDLEWAEPAPVEPEAEAEPEPAAAEWAEPEAEPTEPAAEAEPEAEPTEPAAEVEPEPAAAEPAEPEAELAEPAAEAEPAEVAEVDELEVAEEEAGEDQALSAFEVIEEEREEPEVASEEPAAIDEGAETESWQTLPSPALRREEVAAPPEEGEEIAAVEEDELPTAPVAPPSPPATASEEVAVEALPQIEEEFGAEAETPTAATAEEEAFTAETAALPQQPASRGTEVKPAEVRPPSGIEGPGLAFSSRESATVIGSPDDEALHEEGRRLARLLVSEIRLYNEDEVAAGKRNNDIYPRLREEIDRSRKMYDERIDERVRQSRDYFSEELVRILADGDPAALGSP